MVQAVTTLPKFQIPNSIRNCLKICARNKLLILLTMIGMKKFLLVACLSLIFDFSIVHGSSLSNLTISMISNRYEYYCKEKLQNCHSNGRCLLEKCICNSGWTGEYCSEPVDYPVEPCVPLNCYYDKTNAECTENCDIGYFCNGDCSDGCLYHPEFGVMSVPVERWKLAQKNELGLWVGNPDDTDRNSYHQYHFKNYEFLPTNQLGNVLEMASGPYTQLKTILNVTGASVKSITLLEPQVLEYIQTVPGCSYKDGTLSGHPVTFIVGGAEAMPMGEMFDTVIMINGIEHVQDAITVLHNLYHAIKPGGYLIWHEQYYETYTGKPFVIHPDLRDFIYHPIRIKKHVFEWFLLDHFTTIFLATDVEYSTMRDPGIYFIGRKPLIDQGWDYIVNERSENL